MSELGSGLSLDREWDLYVDQSNGDLAFDEAGEEVRKDLAFNVGRRIQNLISGVPSDGKLRDAEIYVRDIILNDPRIDEVNSIEATYISTQQEVEIDVTATTVTGVEIEQVFTTASS